MSTETIVVISAVIEIILIISFFILIDNVKDIKKQLTGGDQHRAKFAFYLSIGDKEKAKSILSQMIMDDTSFKFAFHSRLSCMESDRKKIQDKYANMMELVDMKFDFDVVDKIIKMKS